MFGFLIILAVISGGLTFGVMMIVGAMLYSGKWALPNSEQRKIQRANVRREVARLESEAAEFQRDRMRTDALRDFDQLKSQGLLMDFQHKLKMQELNPGQKTEEPQIVYPDNVIYQPPKEPHDA